MLIQLQWNAWISGRWVLLVQYFVQAVVFPEGVQPGCVAWLQGLRLTLVWLWWALWDNFQPGVALWKIKAHTVIQNVHTPSTNCIHEWQKYFSPLNTFMNGVSTNLSLATHTILTLFFFLHSNLMFLNSSSVTTSLCEVVRTRQCITTIRSWSTQHNGYLS